MRRVGVFASSLMLLGACFSFGDLTGGEGDGGSDASTDVASGDSDLVIVDSGCGDLMTSSTSCGACGHACDAGVICSEGKCGDQVVQLAVQEDSALLSGACALLHDGTVWCWGDSTDGGGAPAPIPGVAGAVEIAAGADHACARVADGGVSCWGGNEFGQLGSLSGGPVSLPGGAAAKRIFASNLLSCVLTTSSDLVCWGQGANALLELADGGAPLSNFGTYLPTKLLSLPSDLTDLSLVDSEACLIRGGTVQCWGVNTAGGSLGHTQGSDGDLDYGLIVNPFPGTAVSFYGAFPSGKPSGGDVNHTLITSLFGCAVAESVPILACWGDNTYGTLGNGMPAKDSADPIAISAYSGASVFAVGTSSVFATDLSGTSWAWGTNFDGMQATGSLAAAPCGEFLCNSGPTKTLLPKNVTAYAIGNQYGLALAADGSVLAWGSNKNGQLGHIPGTSGDDPNCGSANDGGVLFGLGVCNPTPNAVAGLP